MLLTRIVGHQCCGENDFFTDTEVKRYFGTLFSSFFTLFQVMTLEQWSVVARVVMDDAPAMGVFFVIFILFTNMAIFNLVTAIIVDNVVDVSREMQDEEREALEQEKRRQMERMRRMLHVLDADGDGYLTRKELDAIDPSNAKMRKAREIANDDLFSMLDIEDSGEVLIDEFVLAAVKLTEPLTSKQILGLECDLLRVSKQIGKLQSQIEKQNKVISQFMMSGGGGEGGTTADEGPPPLKNPNTGDGEPEVVYFPSTAPFSTKTKQMKELKNVVDPGWNVKIAVKSFKGEGETVLRSQPSASSLTSISSQGSYPSNRLYTHKNNFLQYNQTQGVAAAAPMMNYRGAEQYSGRTNSTTTTGAGITGDEGATGMLNQSTRPRTGLVALPPDAERDLRDIVGEEVRRTLATLLAPPPGPGGPVLIGASGEGGGASEMSESGRGQVPYSRASSNRSSAPRQMTYL
ncbi:unnamed protein product [Amoebophrya sp. A25]|nr:unnamed protein product [Amoebophrya sp. A25]|eukprot:GSA25T00005540001.1